MPRTDRRASYKYARSHPGREGIRMGEEKVLEFSCPVKITLRLPADCVLDEKALKERLEKVGPQLLMGLCDACPWFREKGRH